jgi:hypothetical protein
MISSEFKRISPKARQDIALEKKCIYQKVKLLLHIINYSQIHTNG